MKRRRTSYNVLSVSNKISISPEKEIKRAERSYHLQINKAIDSLGLKRVILISGPSASGKTTTANKICKQIIATGKKCVVVSLDDFYHNREHLPIVNGKPNAEIVDALTVSLLRKKINNLLIEGHSFLPKYDFNVGKRTDDAVYVDIGNDGIIILEGIHALNPKINNCLNHDSVLKIYVSPHSDFTLNGERILTKREVRFIRRLVRDSWSRNTDPETTMNMWPAVCEGEDTLIRPFAEFADVYINTTHSYEPYIMKDSAVKLLHEISHESIHYDLSLKYISKLDSFFSIDKSLLPETSLLNEFLNV